MNKNFFIDCPIYMGEMLPFERFKLFNWIKEIKPKVIFEIGTGTGGSTFYMSKAIEDSDFECKIYTCDPIRNIDNQILSENVIFHSMYSNDMIDKLVNSDIIPDFIFFDGPENPDIAFNDLKKLEEHIKIGTFFSMHDWETKQRGYDNGISTKSVKVREYIESSQKWEEIEVTDGCKKNSDFDDYEFDSVGICLYKFLG